MTEQENNELKWTIEIHQKINGAKTEEERNKYIAEYYAKCGEGAWEKNHLVTKIDNMLLFGVYDNSRTYVLTDETTPVCKMFNKVFNSEDKVIEINYNQNLFKCLEILYNKMIDITGQVELRELEEAMVMSVRAAFSYDGENLTEEATQKYNQLAKECFDE